MTRPPDSERRSPYEGATIALLTQHGKQRAIAPPMRAAFQARIAVVDGYDTDQLGTFTREIPRAGDQLEAARKKAALALELSGLPLAVASEGSFGPGPLGVGGWQRELVLFVDAVRGLEIAGWSAGPGHHEHALVHDYGELHRVAKLALFPSHGLVLRPNDERDPRCRKGIRGWRDLDREYASVKRESTNGAVFVETDLRAHVHPTRMASIAVAAGDLVERMNQHCAQCEAPGFGVIRTLGGLPCVDCGAPTAEARADELGCTACDNREVRPHGGRTFAEPFHCSFCNP